MQEPQPGPPGMSPVEVVVDVFGGYRAVGRALDIEASTVLRWGQRPGGYVPHEYMRPLLDAAHNRHRRLTLEEIVWGRPGVHRTIFIFEAPLTSGIDRMARALTS